MTHYRFTLSNPHDTISVDIERSDLGLAISTIRDLYGTHYSIDSVQSPLYCPPANRRSLRLIQGGKH